MKKLWILVMAVLLLCGCSQPDSLETVADPVVTPEIPAPMVAVINPPLEAVQQTATDEASGKLYICDGYTLSLQTLPGGDLRSTVCTTTGFEPGQLDIIETQHNAGKQYRFVWTASTETGQQICRATILDDGYYHYVLTAMAPYETAGSLSQSKWKEVFASFRIMNPEDIVSSGS